MPWTIVTSFATRARWLVSNWTFHSWDVNLLRERTLLALFYIESDESSASIANWAEGLELTQCNRRCCGHSAALQSCNVWASPRGHAVLTCPRAMPPLPDWYPHTFAEAFWAVPLPYRSCRAGNVPLKEALKTDYGYNAEYVAATKLWSYPLLSDSLLTYFDFFLKIDIDVLLCGAVADAPSAFADSGAILLHTGMGRDPHGCVRTLDSFMALYMLLYGNGCKAEDAKALAATAWEGGLPGRASRAISTAATRVLASYLVGGDLDFFQSKSVLHFARRWWTWEGGWTHRWTDQQFWLHAIRAANVPESDATMLDLSWWHSNTSSREGGPRILHKARPSDAAVAKCLRGRAPGGAYT